MGGEAADGRGAVAPGEGADAPGRGAAEGRGAEAIGDVAEGRGAEAEGDEAAGGCVVGEPTDHEQPLSEVGI